MAALVGEKEQEIESNNLKGHRHSQRTKRATPTSRAMAKRNELINRMVQNILDRDENIETKDAFDIAKNELATEMHAVQRAEGVEGYKSVLPYLHTNNDACNNVAPIHVMQPSSSGILLELATIFRILSGAQQILQ